MLTIENAHVPISVSVGDTFDRKPTHICEKDPVELVRKFMEELERRGENIRTKVRAAFMPDDVRMLPKVQRIKIEEWCYQVPVFGFDSRRYDLNLIREHFAERNQQSQSGQNWKQDHVPAYSGIPLPRHHQLPRAGDQLRKVDES